MHRYALARRRSVDAGGGVGAGQRARVGGGALGTLAAHSLIPSAHRALSSSPVARAATIFPRTPRRCARPLPRTAHTLHVGARRPSVRGAPPRRCGGPRMPRTRSSLAAFRGRHPVTHRHTPSHAVTHRHTPSHTVTDAHGSHVARPFVAAISLRLKSALTTYHSLTTHHSPLTTHHSAPRSHPAPRVVATGLAGRPAAGRAVTAVAGAAGHGARGSPVSHLVGGGGDGGDGFGRGHGGAAGDGYAPHARVPVTCCRRLR